VTGHWIEELNQYLGFELDEPDANGYTPLMHALMYGKTQIVRNLIHKGADCTEPVRRASGGRRRRWFSYE
jgi:ankyrin repeat protein